MSNMRWFNISQPQTLQSAVILLYLNAAIALLFGLMGGGVIGILALAGVAGGYGIANEKKWGYYLALVVAIIPAVLHTLILLDFGTSSNFSNGIITLLFEIALVVLLVHPMSREYQRIWFK